MYATLSFLPYLMSVSHNYYGTTIGAVEAVAQTGRTCILDIEMEVRFKSRKILISGSDECQKDVVKCKVFIY